MEKGEGPVILNTYKINAFPTLLFVNGEGGEVYRIVGSKKEAELLQVGADALASKNRLSGQSAGSAANRFDRTRNT